MFARGRRSLAVGRDMPLDEAHGAREVYEESADDVAEEKAWEELWDW